MTTDHAGFPPAASPVPRSGRRSPAAGGRGGIRGAAGDRLLAGLPARPGARRDSVLITCEVAGRSRRTIDWYRTYLDDFAKFASRDGGPATLEDLAPAIARRWLLATQSTRARPLAPNSVAGRVRTLRAFAGWVQNVAPSPPARTGGRTRTGSSPACLRLLSSWRYGARSRPWIGGVTWDCRAYA